MKRYLVTMTGRSNNICLAIRGKDVCDCYVYAHNKNEAISKFWEQIEKNDHLSGFPRRDWKITAERWEKGEVDINGNPLEDISWAIPFDLLAVAEWKKDHSYNLTAPETEEKEMNQPEPEKVTESKSQPIKRLNGAPRLIEDSEKVTESTTEPKNSKSTHQVITRDQINSWNRMVNEIAGTKLWHRFVMCKEYKNGSRWVYLTHNASIRGCYKEQDGEIFFIKKTKDRFSGESNFWLYWENRMGTDSERWLLDDMALEFFGVV